MITTILTVVVVASLRATRGQGRRPVVGSAAPPFRTASPEELAAIEPLWSRRARSGPPDGTGVDRSGRSH